MSIVSVKDNKGEIMTGLGTIINSISSIAGGLVGHITGKLFRVEQQEALNKACGVSVLFIGIAGAMEGMLSIDGGKISSGKSMLVVLCLAIGTIIGELIGIEHGFESFGEWLKQKTGNSKDAEFVNAFVTASLTVSIGAMAIVGSIQDGAARFLRFPCLCLREALHCWPGYCPQL